MRVNRFNALWAAALCAVAGSLVVMCWRSAGRPVHAQTPSPSILVPNLSVRTVATGFNQPTSIAFLDANRFFILEKATGKVKLVVNGVVQSEALDLAVNNASERGLLGIALHPNFPTNPGVYLYWTCQAPPPPPENPFFHRIQECTDQPLI